jgi:hypothetical protein
MKNLLTTWPIIAAVVVVVVLVIVLVVTLRRAEMRRVLGLPRNSKLGEGEKQIFQAFEDTDMKLGKTMPKLSKAQRQAMAKQLLRRKGLLPRK